MPQRRWRNSHGTIHNVGHGSVHDAPGRNAGLTRLANQCGSVCYFVRLDGLVKIGYASDLRRRLSQLKAPYDDVLWIEPGAREREHELHALFASDRVKGELFTLSTDLVAYVNARRTAAALPPLAA